MGILHSRCHYCERMRGRACQESHVCCVRLLHDQLYLPGCGRMDMGLRLVGLSAGRGLHGFCGQRHRALDGWRECSGRHCRARPTQGSLREPRGVRVPQLAPGGAGHLCALVRMVWLQPGLHTWHAHGRHRGDGGTSGHEHHPVRRHRRHHSLHSEIRHHEEVRCGWPLQWYPGRSRVHHRWLRQRGVRQRLRHRTAWCLRVPGLVHALAEAEDRRPCGCQPGARLLWHLGCAGSRTL
mmetsp:Transcript_42232/g.100687  ORF Transcript_42232/g.100687 Transcript_42232/m.100687 type:complete len:238 (+) Transcript_42232:570-1283(+)